VSINKKLGKTRKVLSQNPEVNKFRAPRRAGDWILYGGPYCLWVHSMSPAYDANNFKVALRFLENLCTRGKSCVPYGDSNRVPSQCKSNGNRNRSAKCWEPSGCPEDWSCQGHSDTGNHVPDRRMWYRRRPSKSYQFWWWVWCGQLCFEVEPHAICFNKAEITLWNFEVLVVRASAALVLPYFDNIQMSVKASAHLY